MDRSTTETVGLPLLPLPQSHDVLTEVLRRGAQQLLAQAVEAEVADAFAFAESSPFPPDAELYADVYAGRS